MKKLHIPYSEMKPALHSFMYGNSRALDQLVRARGGLIRCHIVMTGGPNMEVPWFDPDYAVTPDGVLDLQPDEWTCHDRSDHSSVG